MNIFADVLTFIVPFEFTNGTRDDLSQVLILVLPLLDLMMTIVMIRNSEQLNANVSLNPKSERFQSGVTAL